MEMGERSKGKLSHASSYVSSRADRFHSGISPAETFWKSQRGNNPSLPNWQRDRRQVGGTDNPAANYYVPDPYRKFKNLAIPNSSLANYSAVQNTEPPYRCPQNHRSTRNKVSIVNNMAVLRKGNEFKEDAENDTDDDDDDDDELGGDAYYDYEVNAREEEEENPEESCGSCETPEKDRDDLEEDVDDDYGISPASQRFPIKYEKNPLTVMERLKMLDLAQAKLKLHHQRRLQKKYQEMATCQRGCHDIPEHDVTDEATEDDDEVSSRPFLVRKIIKQPNSCRQPSSWLSSRTQDKYSSVKSSQQPYHYSKRNETIKSSLEPSIESNGQKRTCRYCGGTGSYPTEPVISRKNNCRVHESTKVSFNTKEKFDGESGDPGERCTSGRRISPRSNFANISPTPLSSQKPRRSRNTRSPNRG